MPYILLQKFLPFFAVLFSSATSQNIELVSDMHKVSRA